MLYNMYFPTFVGVLRELLLFLRKKIRWDGTQSTNIYFCRHIPLINAYLYSLLRHSRKLHRSTLMSYSHVIYRIELQNRQYIIVKTRRVNIHVRVLSPFCCALWLLLMAWNCMWGFSFRNETILLWK